MGKAWIADVLGWSAILLWLALTAYFFLTRDPSAFQAVGVVGIAAGIGYFVMQRHATPHPYGALELESLLSNRVSLATNAAMRSLAHTAILAKVLELDAAASGKQPHPAVIQLASVTNDHLSSTLAVDLQVEVEKQREILAASVAANHQVERARRNSELFQAIVVIIATLQSGLGAYIFNVFAWEWPNANP